MKKVFITFFAFALLFTFNNAEARTTRVSGYYKPSTGTYVSSYYKTSPNSTRLDNWSTKGNYNPYTGKKGYTSPYKW
ncbi:MAG: hypothetical protein WCS89_02065 [Candidatus Paceibacterota bacterium]